MAGESQTLNGDGHERIMMDIIRERVQEEITTYLDKNSASGAKSDRPRLVRSHFHVVNIAPQINLLEYAQKKLERRTNADSKPEYLEPNQKQLLNDPVSGRKPSGIAPNVPNKVTDMFRRLSQENFRGLGGALGGDILRCELNQSDEDSIILDDEEFDKINGHTGEQNDKQQKRNRSGGHTLL